MSIGMWIMWLFASASIGWAGGVVAGLRVGRANPSRKALDAHDERVLGEFTRRLHELAVRGRRPADEGGERG
ncbi:hypothetical protein [Amycolatopsis japonica]